MRPHAFFHSAFFRFLLVGGGFSAIFALTTTVLINFFDTPPLPTSIAVYALCIPLAFTAQDRFTFRGNRNSRHALLIYAGVQIACLAVVSTISSTFVSRVFWLDTLVYLVTAAVAALFSFAICRFVIFRVPQDQDAQ